MLIRLLFILRRRWPIVLLLPVLAASAAYAFTPRGRAVVPSAYVATATIAADQEATPVEIQQAIVDAEQGEIARAVAEQLGDGLTASEVGDHLFADFDDQTFIVTLDLAGETEEEAERYARAYSTTFIELGNGEQTGELDEQLEAATQRRDAAQAALDEFLALNGAALAAPTPPPALQVEQQSLNDELTAAESSLSDLQEQIQATSDVFRLINVEPASRDTIDKLQIPASVPLRLSLGLIFGLLGAGVLIAIVEKLNPRIDSPEHATEIVGAPVLAMVPVMGRRRSRRAAIRRATMEVFRGPFAESFRSARTHLEFRAAADGREMPPRIMITSATPSEGKSTTAAFLALAFAEVGKPPIVVGGDLRRPSVHQFFEVPRIPGLSSRATAGGSSVPLDEIVKVDPETGIAVVPAGPAIDRVTGLLGDVAAVTLAGQTSGRTVLLDTAPVMVANDAVDFLSAVDWVVVVVRVGRSTERAVRQMMQSLELNEANVVGVVMVGSLESSDAKRYYYSYYAEEGDEERRITRAVLAPSSDGTPVPTTGSIGEDEHVGST